MFEARNHQAPGARLWSPLSHLGAYAPIGLLFLVGLPMRSLSRIALMLWQWDRVAATGIWPEMLLQGIRVDITRYGHAMAVPTPGLLGFLCQISLQRPSGKRKQLSNREQTP